MRAFERLRRVHVRWPTTSTPTAYEDLADVLAQEPDVLCIVHLRADAQTLCKLLDARLGDATTVHLSALMCAEHRSVVIDRVKRDPNSRRLVATQVVEAGVDFDFRMVYRAFGGMDALAQAAGRCNREGKSETLGELRVFVAPTQPPRGVPRLALGVSQTMLAAKEPIDLFDPATFVRYFKSLYGLRDLDKKELQSKRERLEFKTVSELYRIIEDDWSSPVVVPFGRAPDLVSDLEHAGPSRSRLRALQRVADPSSGRRGLKLADLRLRHTQTPDACTQSRSATPE